MWQKEPFLIEVKAGDTIYFCKCGKSESGPYCDGSHKGSGIEPYEETFSEDTVVYACGCQQSTARPYCDGSHRKLTTK
ncbi:MAG: hypothetical protein Kow00108_26650 [Calditrichia bacterium]